MDAAFPIDEQQFAADERISFSRLDNKYIAVRDDGAEFEFDAARREWVPADEGEDALDLAGEANGDASIPDLDPSSRRRRREDGDEGAEENGKSKPARPAKKQKKQPQPRQNTAVYVTGLPLDVTVDEVHDVFSRKGGVIAEEIDSGKPRIKLYNDDAGNFKGDALIVFFKPQSVEMAIMLLDDTDFRITASGNRDGRIKVQAADSSYKKVQYDQENGEQGGAAAKVERKPQQKDRDRQKIIKKTQKLDAKLADWDDDDPYQAVVDLPSKKDKTVILRRMFTLAELEEDPAALLEIKEDIRDECAKLGQVTNVVLYDQEVDGIVSVKFADADAAQACIKLMRGRNFDGRTVEAGLATGTERFRKSKKAQSEEEDSE